MKGSDIFLEILKNEGVRYLFGNPGHTELTILDRLVDMPELTYVLALHEGPGMAMADGYAVASGKLGVFCGHIMPGLGNSLGMLFDAAKHASPLLVTVGQQDQGFSLTEPFLWGDLVQQARGLTKWAYEVRSVGELERALQRAIKVAMTPPCGPVFLSLPKDVTASETEFAAKPVTHIPSAIRADKAAVASAAQALAGARQPLIIAGDEVGRSGAEAALERLASLIGAAVYSETASIRFNFPPDHPLYQGTLGRMQREVREVLDSADVVFAVGAEIFTMAAAAKTEPMPPTARLIQLNLDAWQLGKNYVAAPALWGNPDSTLGELADEITRIQTAKDRSHAEDRTAGLRAQKERKLAELDAIARQRAAERPMAGIIAMTGVVENAPANAIIVDESATSGLALRGLLARRPMSYLGLKAGGLGWSLPASIGVSLAHPDRPIICLAGDGAALFSIQALWTAAHHKCRIVYVICNNAQYRLIKHRLHLFGGGASARAKTYFGSELREPTIDFVGLAQSFGVRAVRVENPDEMPAAMRAALSGEGPALIDLQVEGAYPEREARSQA